MVVIYVFQFSLCIFIFEFDIKSQITTAEYLIPDIGTGFARFITGIMMHVCMNLEIKQGMEKMKYALNHSWKFD